MPASGRQALDIGARDGHFSLLMAERFEHVVALDLSIPNVVHPKVTCQQGNAADLMFDERAFDFVFCAEVLERVPLDVLPRVCKEIERVANDAILIGVPYRRPPCASMSADCWSRFSDSSLAVRLKNQARPDLLKVRISACTCHFFCTKSSYRSPRATVATKSDAVSRAIRLHPR